MINKKNSLVLAATLLSTAALAHGDRHGMNWGSNSFSDEPRHASSPSPIVEPFTGFPETSMSTIDDRPGYLSRALVGGRSFSKISQGGDIDIDNDVWTEDRTVTRASAPRHTAYGEESVSYRARPSYFAAYGDDVTALRGIEAALALNHLHHMNQSEIGMAKMAETKAKNPSVLNLAHQVRHDHEMLEKKVEELAAKKDIKLESFQLSTWEQVVKDKLDALDGAEFENAFLKVSERNHDMAMADLRMIRDDVRDEQVVSLVEEAIPAVHAHRNASQINGRAMMDEGDLGE